jgi:hypothetical protein
MLAKPYGIVWKSGEWPIVAEPVDETLARYRLKLVDHLAPTGLRFNYTEQFDLRAWGLPRWRRTGKATWW